MKTKFIALLAAASIQLASCIQNNSYPLRNWIGVGNCTPTLLQREFRVVDSSGKPVDYFSIMVGIKPPEGYIPTPFYGDFVDMERKLNGDDYFIVRIINGRVSNSHVPKVLSPHPIQIISAMNNDRKLSLAYATYFPKSIRMILQKDGCLHCSDEIMIKDMPTGDVSTIVLD